MPRHRIAYLLFVAIGFAELATLAEIGHSRITTAAVIGLVILLVQLGRRSRIAWWVFVLCNGWLLVSSASFLGSSGEVTWGNVITLCIGSSALLTILVGPDMRTWVKPTSRRLDRKTGSGHSGVEVLP